MINSLIEVTAVYFFAIYFSLSFKIFTKQNFISIFIEMFSNRSSLSESRRPISMICPSSGADVSADGEGYDFDDVTETKRRKSKIELDR